MKIILGSSSKWRKSILENIIPGVPFEVISPDIDEKSIRSNSAEILTKRLATAKCAAVRQKVTEPAVIITSDQVVTWCDKIREKPVDREEARYFLKSYRFAPAACVTAVYVCNTATEYSGMIVDVATVWFRNLTNDAIERIIDEGIIFTCSGGFAAGHESFKPYVQDVQGEIESVMGLPKALTKELIENALGVE